MSVSEVLNALDMPGAVRDIKRFNYVCRVSFRFKPRLPFEQKRLQSTLINPDTVNPGKSDFFKIQLMAPRLNKLKETLI